MEMIMLGIVAVVFLILLFAIILKYPKTSVELFFFLACILPSYFALELSGSLPLLTATRLLILLLLFYAVTHRNLPAFKRIVQVNRLKMILGVYFATRIIAELYFAPSLTSYVIKELFSIIFEQLMVVILISKIVTTEKMFNRCINCLVVGASVIFVVGIIQSLSGVNLAYFLNTVHRTMLQTNGFRLGFTRAEASFGHPVYFGEFCVLLMPIISYLYDYTGKKKYMIALCLDLVALVLSNARGAILPGAIILVVMIMRKSKKAKIRYVGIGVIGILSLILLSFLIPSLGEILKTIINSILNIFGANIDLGSNYGGNTSGLESRTSQLTGITWVIMNGAALFGFGPDAHMRGLVSYYFNSRWNNLQTIDVGYVGFFLCEGVIGTIGQLTLIWGLIIHAHKRANKRDIMDMNNAFFLCFFAYASLLLSAAGLNMTYWTIIGLYLAYNNIQSANKMEQVL